MRKIMTTFVAVAFAASVGPAFADDAAAVQADKAGQDAKEAGVKAQKDDAVKDATRAITALNKADPSLSKLFGDAAGYAVFAQIGKGAVGIGGAHGTGVLFEKGNATGTTTLSQLTVGAQIGGQVYSEVIFFDTKEALANFRKGEFVMAAQVSAVAVKAGASKNAKYEQGVAVFTLSNGGLMAEASIGGQKFSFEPFAKAT